MDNLWIWLVVELPLWKIWVNWDDDIINRKNKSHVPNHQSENHLILGFQFFIFFFLPGLYGVVCISWLPKKNLAFSKNRRESVVMQPRQCWSNMGHKFCSTPSWEEWENNKHLADSVKNWDGWGFQICHGLWSWRFSVDFWVESLLAPCPASPSQEVKLTATHPTILGSHSA